MFCCLKTWATFTKGQHLISNKACKKWLKIHQKNAHIKSSSSNKILK